MKSPAILVCLLVVLLPFISGENWVDVGGSISLACKIPMEDPFALEWSLNNETLDLSPANGYSIVDELHDEEAVLVSVLTIQEAKPSQSGTYRCNKFSTLGHIVLVMSADAETEKKNEINFERSQDVLTLNCSLTNNPDKVEWSKDGQKLEMAAGEGGVMQLKDREAVTFTHNSGANVHALNVRKPKVTDVGNYVCSSVGSEDVESEKFNVLMPTIIQKIVALNNIIDGEELLLTCNVIGNPPAEISWFKVPEPESKDLKDTWMSMDSKVKIENDTRITITSSGMHTTMSSVLNIKDITLEDRFVYMCLADNQMVDNGVATNSTILIRVVGKYAALWPFLGICAEVIVLCTVIFIYEKRRGNKKFDEDGDQSSSKHAVNAKDSEVRHRK